MTRAAAMLTRILRSPWAAAALFAAVYGVQTTGEAQFREITAAPFTMNLPPEDQFNYGSPFTFFIGSYYQHHGVDTGWAFDIVGAIGLALFATALWAMVAQRYPQSRRSTAALAILVSPVLFVLLSWVGKSDSYLLAFFLLFTIARSPFTQALLCALMVLCHRELGALVLLSYAALTLRDVRVERGAARDRVGGRAPVGARPVDRTRWSAAIAGLAAGEALVFVYTHWLLSPAPQTRAGYALGHAAELWAIFTSHPVLHVIATFGPFWVLVLSRARVDLVRALVFGAALVISIASYDFTRVFTILAFPLVLAVTADVARDVDERGAIRVAGVRLPPAALLPLLFLQVQCQASRLLLAQGIKLPLP